MQTNIDGNDARVLREEQRDWLCRRQACETRAGLTLMDQARAARLEWLD